MSNPISYTFQFAGNRNEVVRLDFTADMEVTTRGGSGQEWTRLDRFRCPHCPLATNGDCPFATAMAPFINMFDDFYSYDPVIVHVTTTQRHISAQRDLQHGLASLLGLVGATSGCPHLAFFRPMARFHLPFSSIEETLYRAFSAHLLGRFFAHGGNVGTHDCGDGTTALPVDFDQLRRQYEDAALVNHSMADRIRSVCRRDAVVNALITLDSFAQTAPAVIEDRLSDLAYIFTAGQTAS